MVTPIGRDIILLLFLNFSFYVFPRGGGPLRTVIVICGSCREIIMEFFIGENHPVEVSGDRSRSGVPEANRERALAFPFLRRMSVRIKAGAVATPSVRFPTLTPVRITYPFLLLARDMELDFQIDTSWCMGCSRQILPKRSYTPTPQQLPAQPPTRTC